MRDHPNNNAGKLSPQPGLQSSRSRSSFTVDTVNDTVRKAARGADELNQNLRETFELSDSSAALRLR